MKSCCNWFLTIMGLLPLTSFAQDLTPDKSMLPGTVSPLPSLTLPPAGAMSNMLAPSKNTKEDKEQLLHETMRINAMVQRSWLASMIIPGLGQVYNKHYWKVPCFYLGFVLLGKKIYNEHRDMNQYKRQKLVSDQNPDKNRPANLPHKDYITRRINECERARNLFILILSAWYIINILDAYAGAHGKTVNFTDDIGTVPPVTPAIPSPTPTALIYPSAATPPLLTVSFPIFNKG